MKLIDTHCHLCHGRLKGRADEVLRRAREASVAAVICAAGELAESGEALAFARAHAGVYFTAGVHPHEAKGFPPDRLGRIEELAADARNVAIGEIGLDYHYDFSPRDAQRRTFAAQLDLARRLGKPVVVHTREAFADTLATLRESGVDGRRVVFHSFTEDAAPLRASLDFGAMISFSGIVTFRPAAALRAAAATVPDDRLFVETDAPYLSPEPVRKMKTNEPANVVHVAACLAQARGTTLEALAELTTANAIRFFGLGDIAADPENRRR